MPYVNKKFIVKDSMLLWHNEIEVNIDLCLGDITDIGENDKVDILLISAHSDSYGSPPGTVIHSLNSKLKVSVSDLAKDKEVDRRIPHKCWWSKPIQTAGVPFGRVLCYESGEGTCKASEFTNKIYICLQEIYDKKPFKVATSLLNTGVQNIEEVVMLDAIIDAAIAAMKGGLFVKQLMIFINATITDENMVGKPTVKNYEGICEKFEALKKKHCAS